MVSALLRGGSRWPKLAISAASLSRSPLLVSWELVQSRMIPETKPTTVCPAASAVLHTSENALRVPGHPAPELALG